MNIDLRNGSVRLGNKLLPESLLIKIYDAIGRK